MDVTFRDVKPSEAHQIGVWADVIQDRDFIVDPEALWLALAKAEDRTLNDPQGFIGNLIPDDPIFERWRDIADVCEHVGKNIRAFLASREE